MIKKTVRVGTVQMQDEFRREDMLRMSPAERVMMLMELRDAAFSYEPFKRIASIRKFD
jgi:hypothetical protein